MIRRLCRSSLLVLMCFAVQAHVMAQNAETIHYQGFLVDEDGQPFDGIIDLTFRMYGAAGGGPVLWDEVQGGIPVDKGLFSVELGSVIGFDLVDFSQPLWLSVQVGQSQEMEPRVRLGSVPHALTVRGLRIEASGDRWNVMAGNPGNHIADNLTGATVSGGGMIAYASGPGGTIPVVVYNNRVFSDYGTIGGGLDNHVSGLAAVVGGGKGNRGHGVFSAVSGGESNSAGGEAAVVAGGKGNRASGDYAVVPGGAFSHARGNYSMAVGFNARAAHDGSFVWNDQSLTGAADSLVSTGPNQFIIRAVGGVGIGTNTPSSTLHVKGGIGAGAIIERDGGATIHLTAALNEGSIGTRDARAFRVITDNAVRMHVAPEGNVGIGTTSPSERLHVNGRVRATEFVTTSDARLKTDVLDLHDALEVVMQLRGVSYVWDEGYAAGRDAAGARQMGFLAQEVRDVLPDVVRADDRDELSVAYSQIVPLLVEAVKEQQKQIEALTRALESGPVPRSAGAADAP